MCHDPKLQSHSREHSAHQGPHLVLEVQTEHAAEMVVVGAHVVPELQTDNIYGEDRQTVFTVRTVGQTDRQYLQ